MTTDPPRYRRLTAEARRAELVAEGIACLAENGIASFTLDNICARSGVTRGLVAHHFGSKDGLLIAVLTTVYQSTLDELGSLENETDFHTLFTRAFVGATTENLRIWLALWGEVAVNPVLRAEHRKLYARYEGLIEQAIKSIRPDAEASALSVNIIACFDGLWLKLALDPETFSKEEAIQHGNALLAALLA
jgi:AcrR family transcriptional regulator